MHALSRRSPAALLLATLCLGATMEAHATCNPGERHFIYVGDTASDAQCNFDAIQDATRTPQGLQRPETIRRFKTTPTIRVACKKPRSADP